MQFDLVKRLGVTVLEVPGLDVDVAYVARHNVALIRCGLDPCARQKAADWVLEEATQAMWSPRPTS